MVYVWCGCIQEDGSLAHGCQSGAKTMRSRVGVLNGLKHSPFLARHNYIPLDMAHTDLICVCVLCVYHI